MGPLRHPTGMSFRAAGIMILAGLCGCAPEEPEVHPVWPPPPAEPRIIHRKNVAAESDLVKPGFLDRMGILFTGQDPLRLFRPHAVAVLEDQRMYVTDQELQAVVMFDLKSPRSALIQRAGEVAFVSPVGVVVCGREVVVSDSALKAVFVLAEDGVLRRSIQKPGGFQRPTGLAFDAKAGLLYVADTLANEICVFDFASGRLLRRFGSPGVEPRRFNYPTHICLAPSGNLLVTDSLNFRVQAFDPNGRYLFEIGRLGDASGHLAVPKGVAVDRWGHVYIVDSYFSTVQVFDQKGRFLLGFGEPGDAPGEFHLPTGILVDSQDRIYVCDSFNRRIQVFQYIGATRDEENPSSAPSTAPGR